MSSDARHAGALVYARALLEALDAAGGGGTQSDAEVREADAVLYGVAEAFRTDRLFRGFFLASNIRADAKRAALDRLVHGRMPTLVGNFLRLLERRGRLSLLPHIGAAFRKLADARLGRVPVRLTTAVPIDEVSLRTWTERIRKAVGGEPVVAHEVRADILAGAIVRVGDVVADGSARRRLAAFHKAIIEKGRSHALQS